MPYGRRHIHASPPRYVHHFSIELARSEALYRPGEAIEGRVVVHATADEPSVGLWIELQAHTHGRVKSVAKVLDAPLYQGALRAGESRAFPFRCEAPKRAPHYHGRLFTLETRLALVAYGLMSNRGMLLGDDDLARAYPAQSQIIQVMPDLRPPVVALDQANVLHANTYRSRMVIGGFSIAMLAVMTSATGVLLQFFGVLEAIFAWLIIGSGLLLAGLGGAMLLRHLPGRIAERRIGVPRIHVDERAGPAGPVVFVAVAMAPGVRVNRVSAAIQICERVEATAQSHSSEERHPLHEVPIELRPAHEPGAFHGSVPKAAFLGCPAAFAVPAVQIAWFLALHIDLPNGADWDAEILLDAFPGGEVVPIPAQTLFSFG